MRRLLGSLLAAHQHQQAAARQLGATGWARCSPCALLGGAGQGSSGPQQPEQGGATPSGGWGITEQCACRRSITTSAGLLAEDYYAILGLTQSASDQDIKRAYYKLAKQFHPDTNKDNPEAAKRFQDVQKAYETLRDPEKRKMYDQIGPEGMERMESAGGGGPEPGGGGSFRGGFPGGFPFGGFGQDIFEQLFEQSPAFAQMFGRVAVSPIRISFLEAVQGTRRRIQLGGARGMPATSLDVVIPAGVDTGDHVEVPLETGAAGRRGASLRVAIPIEVEPHAYFRREGADISVSAELPLHSALLGTTIQVPTLEGTADVVIPPCTGHGEKLRLRGRGIYDVRRGSKGDLYVELHIQMPKALTDKQKQLLAQFKQEEDSKKSKRSGFF